MKRNMSILLTIILLYVSVFTLIFKSYSDDGNVVPDTSLRKVINYSLGRGADNSGPVTISDLDDLTGKLDTYEYPGWDLGILSLEGLQYAENIKGLHIPWNKVSDLTPISDLTKLESLNIRENNIDDLTPISGLINLTDLHIGRNRISDISVLSNLEKLENLTFYDNEVSDLSPLSDLTNLEYLGFSENEVSDLSPLSDLTNLEYLSFDENGVSDLSPLSDLTNLESLYFSDNEVSDLSPLSGIEYKEKGNVSAFDQEIKVYLDSPYEYESHLVGLRGETVNYFEYDSSQVSKNGDTFTLLNDYSNLTWAKMYIRPHPVEEYREFGAYRGTITLIKREYGDVIPDDALKKDINRKLGKGEVTTPISREEVESLTGLLSAHNYEQEEKIESIEGLQYAVNIDSLGISHNQISDLSPISELTNLKSINFSNNQISDIGPISGLLNLEIIDFSNNQISDITPISYLTNLEKVWLNGNQISNLAPISNVENVLMLYVNSNNISDLSPLGVLKEIETLEFNDNKITDLITLSDMESITWLSFSGNAVSDIKPLEGLLNLNWLKCSENKISDLSPLSQLLDIVYLNASNQRIDKYLESPYEFENEVMGLEEDMVDLSYNEEEINKMGDIYILLGNSSVLSWDQIYGIPTGPYEMKIFSGELRASKVLIENPEEPLPDGYHMVVFDGGDHGSLKGTAKFAVSEGVDFSVIPVPEVQADPGYKFSNWEPSLPNEKVMHDLEFTAMFEQESFPSIIERLFGKDRYETAVEVSKMMYDQSDTVILVNGRKYPDALASTPLAKLYNAPILLVEKDVIPTSTKNEIARLGATKAIIVGGKGVVSEYVVAELEEEGLSVERYSGKSRYETSLSVAEKVIEIAGEKNIILVKGTDFPDALTVTALALKEDAPILLTRPANLSEEVNEFIEGQKPSKLYIAGGKGAVSLEIESDIEDLGIEVMRFSGKDRYETGRKIAEYVYPNPDEIIFANGRDFADAMVGGPLTIVNGGPVMLVEKTHVPQSTKDYMTSTVAESVDKAYIVGGEGVVSNSVREELLDIIGD
ncbi:MAG: hypothetical protein CSB16_00260 [Clostridiales bacterium]|nr:MAG: hypothetical protein CSB16_00260 [Clostridiales bacterium]